ncbi:aryl-sulfate sulfotransferase [Metabacillus fastidiosus]|uniref:aryl-sulfate sulfotransferase n=1 Tax=Metabacillus fastidiosus TaxID=1458 RepID=UPI002DBC3AAA|nr:aryl-sulfate sulfotransferase [Metabacillus fastidiosus]MEC2074795.1 aryl-sulfate sulfotransferase [Metabacillus fastidiosus]
MGLPTIHPTGATIYSPEKAWSGYTIFQAPDLGALLIDMNGKEVHLWKGLRGFPNKIFPGGYVLGHTFNRDPEYGFQDEGDLVQVDFEGNVVWKFDKHEFITDPGHEGRWLARAHHDYQREGNSVGYYAPDQNPKTDSGNTLILAHRDVHNPKISKYELLDDVILEVDWEGNVVWEWSFSDHFDELQFDDEAKKIIYEEPNRRFFGNKSGDWLHINSISAVGPNRHYDAGDERFHPDNIIWDAREANIIGITDKRTGKIVWQIGPDYSKPELKHLGWIIGQHHAHIIPQGLPGEGNLLVFDNGGWGGYGAPNPSSPDGNKNAVRDHSRVLEIDPVTLEIVWQYTGHEAKFQVPTDSFRFYSPYISSAQRLENGNTLITEGANGRIFEVTENHEIVWEYISPYKNARNSNMVYRAYRVPYNWVPQLEKPNEVAIEPLKIETFRVPNAAQSGTDSIVEIKGAQSIGEGALCVARYDETLEKQNN